MAYEYQYVRDVRDSAAPVFYTDRLLMSLVNFAFGIVEFLLAARLVLVFLGAGTGNVFMAWLLGITGQLVGPFAGIFPNLALGSFVLELSTVFAIIAYAIIGWLIVRLMNLLFGLA